MNLLAFIFAFAVFGGSFDPAKTNAPTESCFYPVAKGCYRMVQPDGAIRAFRLTDAKQGIVVSDRPWVGVIKGNRVDVWADPECTGKKLRTAYTFVNGVLRLAVFDGKKYDFVKGAVRHDDLNRLFPARKKRSYEKNSGADIWRRDGNRLRLWFANPNAAGALLVGLALMALVGAIKFKAVVRIEFGLLFLIVLCGMFATGSRGALLGCLLGILCVAAVHFRRLMSLKGLICAGLALAVIVPAVLLNRNSTRIADTFQRVDTGNVLRLKVAKAAVQMFADAPFGWSGGEVPGRNACLNWYVFDESHGIRTHLLTLAELGWIKGFLYIFMWTFLLAIGVWGACRGHALPLAMWLSFAAAGLFNPVYKEWEVWILPLVSLASFLQPRWRLTIGALKKPASISAGLALVTVIVLAWAGHAIERKSGVQVKSVGKATFVNGDSPRIWIVGDELTLGGLGFPGREILGYYRRNPKAEPIAYVYDVEDLPAEAELVVLAGRAAGDYVKSYSGSSTPCKARRIVFLSPSIGPGAVPEALMKDSKVMMIAGNLLSFHDSSYTEQHPWVVTIPGCERYLHQWMKMIMPK